jgi:hypothetical protein
MKHHLLLAVWMTVVVTAKTTAPAILLTKIQLLAERDAAVRRLGSNGVFGRWRGGVALSGHRTAQEA